MARKKKGSPIPTENPPEQSDISNSLRPMRIDITEADIKKGKPLDPSCCAAAQAIMRITGAKAVKVHRGVTYIKTNGGWRRYRTTAALRMETIIFDRGGTFVPGEYDLTIVPITVSGPRKTKIPGQTKRQAALSHRRRIIPQVRRSARFNPNDEGDE